MRRRAFLERAAGAGFGALAASRFAFAADAEVVLTPGAPGPVISPHVYGHFIEHLGGVIYDGIWVGRDSRIPNVDGIRKRFVDDMKRLGAPNLRWPGGCFADGYHWRDGIGPASARPRTYNFWEPRMEILRQLRAATFDILIGINLLREGLDLPEVSLVCILDADKEGFLRNETSMIQTAGRAARHIGGECVLFCDKITDSIQALIDITDYRRSRQQAHNEQHGITPQSVKRALQHSLHTHEHAKEHADKLNSSLVADDVTIYDKLRVIAELTEEMREASSRLEFERAAHLRDQIAALKNDSPAPPMKAVKYPAGKKGRSRK